MVADNRTPIDWGKAPEGTTHAVWRAGPGEWQWRRVLDDEVFGWTVEKWIKRPITTVNMYLKANALILEERPKENLLPDGLEWREGFTHYNPMADGFFFNAVGYVLKGDPLDKPPRKWLEDDDLGYWLAEERTITRYPRNAVNPEVKAPEPPPKKQVGWW